MKHRRRLVIILLSRMHFPPIDMYGVCVKNRSAAARLRSLRAITHDIEWDSIRVYLHFLQANIW